MLNPPRASGCPVHISFSLGSSSSAAAPADAAAGQQVPHLVGLEFQTHDPPKSTMQLWLLLARDRVCYTQEGLSGRREIRVRFVTGSRGAAERERERKNNGDEKLAREKSPSPGVLCCVRGAALLEKIEFK